MITLTDPQLEALSRDELIALVRESISPAYLVTQLQARVEDVETEPAQYPARATRSQSRS